MAIMPGDSAQQLSPGKKYFRRCTFQNFACEHSEGLVDLYALLLGVFLTHVQLIKLRRLISNATTELAMRTFTC